MSVPGSRPPARDAADPATVASSELTPLEIEQSIARVSALYHAELRKLDQVLDLPALTMPRAAAPAALPNTRPPAPTPERPGDALVPPVPATPRPLRPARWRTVLAVGAALLTLCLVAAITFLRPALSSSGALPAATAMNSAAASPTNAALSALPVLATVVPSATPTAPATVVPTLTSVPIATSVPLAAPSVPTPPTATVPIAPTTIPAAVRTPTTPPTLRQRAIMAEKTLQSGRLVATIDYGNGTRATSTLRFDFGGAGQPPTMQLTIVYEGVTGSRSTEFIASGERYWQRAADGTWAATSPLEGVRGQVSGFLPGLGAVGDGAASTTFHWHDDARDAAATLDVDPVTGIPQRLSRVSATNGTTLTVMFTEWNTPQVIDLPQAP